MYYRSICRLDAESEAGRLDDATKRHSGMHSQYLAKQAGVHSLMCLMSASDIEAVYQELPPLLLTSHSEKFIPNECVNTVLLNEQVLVEVEADVLVHSMPGGIHPQPKFNLKNMFFVLLSLLLFVLAGANRARIPLTRSVVSLFGNPVLEHLELVVLVRTKVVVRTLHHALDGRGYFLLGHIEEQALFEP
jgi:hypothetical protein